MTGESELEITPWLPDRTKPEAYPFGPTVSAGEDGLLRAWLELDGEDAHLHTDDGRVPDAGGLLGRPLLCPADSGATLYWSQHRDDEWNLYRSDVSPTGAVSNRAPVTTGDRRPLDPTGAGGVDDGWIAWESIGAEGSDIRGFQRGLEDPVPTTLSDPDLEAAHDAALAVDGDRTVLVYTALRDGAYEIEGRIHDGGSWSAPQRLSSQPAPVAYPTVTPAADGGVWIGWITYQLPIREPDGHYRIEPYVDHERSERQHAFFRNGRAIRVHHWDGDRIRSPGYDADRYESPHLDEALRESGRVFDAYHGTRPRLVVDGDGTLWCLWLDYHDSQERPVLAAAHATEWGWSEPIRTASCYGDAERIHCTRTAAGRIVVAVGRDERTAWREIDGDSARTIGHVELPRVPDAGRPPLGDGRRWQHTPTGLRNPSVSATRTVDGTEYSLVVLNYHRHSDLSVCQRASDGEPELNLRHARYVMGEDSATLTDHCYNSDALARYSNRRAIHRHHVPGAFVTVSSYEWTGTHQWDGEHVGHYNVHRFESSGLPPYGSPTDENWPPNTPDTLADATADSRTLAIAHHTANEAHYLRADLFDHEVTAPVVELFQDHRGSCETTAGPGTTEFPDVDDPACYLQAQLAEGQHFGFLGGGDHTGTATTGVWVEDLTRAGIHDALCARRTVATTGAPIVVDGRIAETFLGGVHETDDEAVTYQCDVEAPDGVQSVQLLQNNDVVETLAVDGVTTASAEWTRERKTATDWFYPRVLLDNGEVAWGSPIWVERA
jgi:hypothetical protein